MGGMSTTTTTATTTHRATVTPVNPWTWSAEHGYEQATLVEGARRTLYCAGQASVDGDGAPLHAGDVGAQVQQALDNLETVLADAGMTFGDIVRLQWFTTDLDAFQPAYGAAVGRLRAAGCRSAGTLVEVSRLALPGLVVEVEATAVR